jgi:Ner family transcriptional regulator
MTASQLRKKPAADKAVDWQWADVLAALKKRGWSLRQIAIAEGYQDQGSTLGKAAREPAPKSEDILARYAGIDHPMVIWPSRYHRDGSPNRRIGRAPMRGQPPVKATTAARARNPQRSAVA